MINLGPVGPIHLLARPCWAHSFVWPSWALGPVGPIHLLGLLGPRPCWAHCRAFICWALLGPGPLGPFICWALLGPGPCWGHSFVGTCWGHSLIWACWAHLSKYSQKSNHCIETSSYVAKKSFPNPILALTSSHHKKA